MSRGAGQAGRECWKPLRERPLRSADQRDTLEASFGSLQTASETHLVISRWLAVTAPILILPALLLPGNAAAQARTVAWEIAAAVTPLPDALRSGARVLGQRDGVLTVLRDGSNAMICLGDDPARRRRCPACS